MALPALFQGRLSIPVIGSPLFIISNPDLVIAQCKAGIVGSFPALNARPASMLDEWLARITEELAAHDRANPDRPAAPFAVNQIVHRSNDRLEQDMAVCERYRVPIVITSLGARVDVNDAVHAWGGITLHDIINLAFARKAVEKGADGLVAVAAGAGGHAGTHSPFALVQEIRTFFDGPLALSGAIATGAAIRAAEVLGADFAYIGSAFIATHEANAADAYKRMIVDHGPTTSSTRTTSPGFTATISPLDPRRGLDPNEVLQAKPKAMDFATKDAAGAEKKAGATSGAAARAWGPCAR
jgi:nitronate monooxygenase